MEPASPRSGLSEDIPSVMADQDQRSWPAMMLQQHKPASDTSADEDFVMVSPTRSGHGSPRMSMELVAHSDHNSVCSESGGQHEALADSVLSQPMMTHTDAADTAAADLQDQAPVQQQICPAAELSATEPDSMDAVRTMSGLSQEGSLDGFSEAEDSPPPTPQAADDVTSPTRWCQAQNMVKCMVEAQVNAGAAVLNELNRDVTVVTTWMMESMAMLVQSARRGTQSVKDAVADALDHLLQLLPHKSKEDGAAVDWKFLGVAAGCVATTAVAVFAVYRNFRLSKDLKTRDHELAKLVMRVVSLQEIMNQHLRQPITRYTSYGIAHTCL
eukprot:jgi/Chrzof1/13848/Cz08g14230.t1